MGVEIDLGRSEEIHERGSSGSRPGSSVGPDSTKETSASHGFALEDSSELTQRSLSPVEVIFNRGQTGQSGIEVGKFKKIDPPAIILAECSVGFVKDYISKEVLVVNVAEVGKYQGKLASEQPLLKDMTGLDEFVLGHKRRPGLSLIDDINGSRKIAEFTTEKFTNEAREQLADALFVSVLAGDESCIWVSSWLEKTERIKSAK